MWQDSSLAHHRERARIFYRESPMAQEFSQKISTTVHHMAPPADHNSPMYTGLDNTWPLYQWTFHLVHLLLTKSSQVAVLIIPDWFVQLQLLQCYWLGHRLGLLWYWMVCLGNRDHSVILRLHPITAFWTLCWWRELLHFSLGILAHSSRLMIIWIKFAHSNLF